MNQNNFCQFEGRLTKDPSLHKVNQSTSLGGESGGKDVNVCNFVLAVEGGRDGQSNEVCFVKCETWHTAADAMMEYRKGDTIFVQGNLKNRRWKDKNTSVEMREDILRVQRFIPVYVRDLVENDEKQEQVV